jgi:hypothetical protein
MIRGRVGRHTQQGGRHCQNWSDDQKFVIALLNLISADEGGAGGRLDGTIGGRIVPGMASDALYGAVSTFEDRHFPRQRSGYVDPGGAMLRRMEEIVARQVMAPAKSPSQSIVLPSLPPIRTSLDRALDDVLIEAPWSQYPAAQRKAFARLVGLAVIYIETLKADGTQKLPYPVVLFGRAYLTQDVMPTMARGSLEFIKNGGTVRPPLIERFGGPIDMVGDITTGADPALLLYDNTIHYRLFPYHTGRIPYLQDRHSGRSWAKAQPLRP